MERGLEWGKVRGHTESTVSLGCDLGREAGEEGGIRAVDGRVEEEAEDPFLDAFHFAVEV